MLSDDQSDLGVLERIELWQSDVAMAEPLRAAHGVHETKRVVYLRVCTNAGEGWGEVGALEAPVGTDPSLDDVVSALDAHWIPKLFVASTARNGACPPSQTISLLGASSPDDLVASSTIEAAILDAELRRSEQTLATWLAVENSWVPFGAVIGLDAASSGVKLLEAAQMAVDAGASRLRVKIDPDVVVDHVRMLCQELQGIPVHGDANGSLDRGRPPNVSDELLGHLDGLGLCLLEQPLSTNDLTTYRALRERMVTPICLDEGLTSVGRARNVARYGAADAFCVKPARLGGVRHTLATLQLAQSAGIDCFIGGYFETGLGRSLLGTLAASDAVTLVSDVVAPSAYLVDDPCGFEGPHGRRQYLWSAPGVGPWPRIEVRGLLRSYQP